MTGLPVLLSYVYVLKIKLMELTMIPDYGDYGLSNALHV